MKSPFALTPKWRRMACIDGVGLVLTSLLALLAFGSPLAGQQVFCIPFFVLTLVFMGRLRQRVDLAEKEAREQRRRRLGGS